MRDRWAAPAVLAAFVAAYLGATLFGLGLSLPGSDVAPFWPAAGVAVAVLVRARRRAWPGLVAAMVAVDVAANLLDGHPLLVALGFATAHATEATIVATLVRRWTVDGRLHRTGDLLLGMLAPAAVGCVVGGAIAAGVAHLGLDFDFVDAVRAWGEADLVGIVTVAPVGLVAPWRPSSRRDLGALVLPAVVTAATVIAFAADAETATITGARLAVAGLLVVAARSPLRVTAVTAAVVTSLAVWLTGQGRGPFASATVLQADFRAVQTAVAVMVLGSLALGLSTVRARETDARLRSLIDHLPHGAMVMERGRDASAGDQLRATYANPAMLQLFGAADVATLGTLIGTAMAPDARDAGERRAAAVADGLTPTAAGTMRVHTSDGSERDLDWSLVTVVEPDGRTSVLAQAVDVTAPRALERELRASEERFRLLAEHAPVGILLTDERGAATMVNAEWRRMSGATSADDDSGRLWVQRIHPEDRAQLADGFHAAIAEGATYQSDYRMVAADGTVRWVAGKAVPIFGDDGQFRGMVGTALDVSDRKRHEDDLARRALHDGLTGLPNREHFEDRLRIALADLDGRRSLSVLFVDLDGFKVVNDTLGHDAGDLVLCEVAMRLTEVVRPPDVVARLGGDEFAVLCMGAPDGADPAGVIHRLRARVSEHLCVGGVDISVGVSIGMATTDDPRAQVGELLRAADRSMYDSKRAGLPGALTTR
jgi:diguanylate cyclase (GGDEF)-like protein/PAS domain S-box-containing protein